MERADWLEERVDSADARFLMVTAITHHWFSSPIWGTREVGKLHAELNEIAGQASMVLSEHQAKAKAKGWSWGWRRNKKQKSQRPHPQYRGVFGAPA